MAPAKKSSDVKEVVPVVSPAPVATTATATPPVEVKKAAAKAKAVKIAPEVSKDAPAAVAESKEVSKEAPVGEVAAEDKESSGDNVIQVLTEKLTALTTLNKEIQVALRQVAKSYDKLHKIVDKIQKKRDNARKSPSGFAKPNKISDELCDFIGVPRGTEKSRTDITRYINSYVKEHNLNKPTNRRIILPDDKLKAILNVKEGEEVTFFILQRLISHHFPSKTAPKPAA
jgi:chromatin remodeling complex protein RSC6